MITDVTNIVSSRQFMDDLSAASKAKEPIYTPAVKASVEETAMREATKIVELVKASKQVITEPQKDFEKAEAARLASQGRARQALTKLNVQFEVEQGTNRLVILMTDKETGEVVRQIPPEVMIELANSMKDAAREYTEQAVIAMAKQLPGYAEAETQIGTMLNERA